MESIKSKLGPALPDVHLLTCEKPTVHAPGPAEPIQRHVPFSWLDPIGDASLLLHCLSVEAYCCRLCRHLYRLFLSDLICVQTLRVFAHGFFQVH